MKAQHYAWYASDFAGSPFVQSLPLIDECCYRRLLDIQATSPDRRISENMDTLRSQCKNLPSSQWKRIWDRLKEKFEPHPDGKGGLINRRQFEIISERDAYLAERSKSGKNGAKSKWKNHQKKDSSANTSVISTAIGSANDLVNGSANGSAYGKRHDETMASKTKEEETPIVPFSLVMAEPSESDPEPREYPDDFEEWWSIYPRKTGKGKACEVWKKIKPSLKKQARMHAAVIEAKESSDWKRDNGKYIPHPATWLGQKRWDDEVTTDKKVQSVHDFL